MRLPPFQYLRHDSLPAIILLYVLWLLSAGQFVVQMRESYCQFYLRACCPLKSSTSAVPSIVPLPFHLCGFIYCGANYGMGILYMTSCVPIYQGIEISLRSEHISQMKGISKNLYSTIYHLRKRVCKWEIQIIASEEWTEISKSLASLRECPSQERVRSTAQRQGRTCH